MVGGGHLARFMSVSGTNVGRLQTYVQAHTAYSSQELVSVESVLRLLEQSTPVRKLSLFCKVCRPWRFIQLEPFLGGVLVMRIL